MSVNHIFIFTDKYNQVAQELLDFGFTEGSNRIHPGQGTRNRKFNFNNFYIEILWVHDENEINSIVTRPTQLNKRANWEDNDCSPFGLCLDYNSNENRLFEEHFKYKPSYLPDGMEIQVLTNESNPYLPWTFRWKTDRTIDSNSSKTEEPLNHQNNIKTLTKVCFGIKKLNSSYVDFFNNSNFVFFEKSESSYLKLEFDNKKSNKIKKFDTIPLTIKY